MPSRQFIAFALLWLSGVGLRTTILAVPPVIPQIQADLQLSGTQVGILSGLPVVFFAVAAIPGSLFIARMGAVRTLAAGLMLTAVAAALRGAIPQVATLYLATAFMGAGVAISQPCAPALIRTWLSERIGLGTAVFTNGMFIGATTPAAATLPLVLPLLGGSWRWELAFWGLMPALAAVLLIALAPAVSKSEGPKQSQAWWPDWNQALVWKLGAIFAGVNSPFFGTNAFLPAYLNEIGRPDLISAALTALNTCQFPASIGLMLAARRIERRPWPMMLAVLLVIVSLGGIVSTNGGWTVFWAGFAGFACGATLVLGLSLPSFLSEPADVSRVSAGMFTLSYASAMLMSVIGGMAWDASGSTRFAFLPLALSTVPILFLMPTLRYPRMSGP